MKLSIKYKATVGLLIIFCIGYNLISLITSRVILQNNEKIISKEFLRAQREGTFYINQYFSFNNLDKSTRVFEKESEKIASELSSKLDDRMIFYDVNGIFLFDTAYLNGNTLDKNHNKLDTKKDIKLAIDDKSSYVTLKENDRYVVNFSYPVYVYGKKLGIVRYTRDYSHIFLSGKSLLNSIKFSVLIVFAIILLFSIVLSRKITIPIIKLNNISKEIAKGNYDIVGNINSKDEIGELAESFNIMEACIKNQIVTIKKDRDNLKKSESHKKMFFDNVTHELKTPLTVISGYSQILMEDDFDDWEFFNKSIRRIKSEADRMHGMVLELLDISKLESNTEAIREKLNVSILLNKLCEDMNIKAKKYGINIEENIKKSVYINGNQEEISRVFINILDNAIKYGSINTNISVVLDVHNKMCISVIKDKGKGIPKEKVDKIFKPFYRVNKTYSREKGSSGLGLFIVKNIIDQYEGEIHIESKENVGTKVTVKIPII